MAKFNKINRNMDALYAIQKRLLEYTSTDFLRYKFDEIEWSGRMLALVGPRGVGKTTMLLQRIKLHHDPQDTLYVSADSTYFTSHTLTGLAEKFYMLGGKNLFIDEVHKYEGWSQELKEIYDSFPQMKVVFTGSSVLDITKGSADLSRRAPIYKMQGMSFREYLQIFHGISVPVHSLDDITANRITNIDHPLLYFNDYLRRGYYPFGRDVAFDMEIDELINKSIEVDIPNHADMNLATARKLKQLLGVVSQSVPFKPNVSSIAAALSVSRNSIPNYLLLLEKAGMIAQLRDQTGGIRGLGKVEKVYLDNPNLAYVLARENTNEGNIRETFFFNQMRVRHDPVSTQKGDFVIGDRTFEVGGKKKKQAQINGLANAFIVKDDIEYGHHNVIPLWAFGLNY